MTRSFRHATLALALAVAPATASADGTVAAGTQIVNTATATYAGPAANGPAYAVASNTVIATVAAVSAVAVTPTEAGCDPSADAADGSQPIVKSFTVTNVSNVADAYAISATVSAGAIAAIAATTADGRQTAVAANGTLPSLAPGASLRVAIAVAASTLPKGTDVRVSLGLRSTAAAANGQAAATGTACAVTAAGAKLGGPQGNAITKLADGASSEAVEPGQRVAYAIAFANLGGVPIANARFTDPLPAGLTADPSSATFDGKPVPATLANGTLAIALGGIAPGAVGTVAFGATLDAASAIGTSFVNVATVSGDNASALASNPAAVLAGAANVVYDGYGGASAPVSDAVVTIVNATTQQPLPVAPIVTSHAAARRATLDAAAMKGSLSTPQDGTYGFAVPPDGSIMTFEIDISATGYRNRRIGVRLVPNASKLYGSATLTALDGQLLASPGAFKLVAGPVTIPNVAGIFGNLPLFRPSTITLTKTVDRPLAAAGDRLVYTLGFANVSIALGSTTLVDTLPAGVTYAPGTARYDGVPREPARAGRTLTWTFPALTAGHTVAFAAVLSPGAAPGSTVTNLASIAADATGAPPGSIVATATASTAVAGGLFDGSGVITGRVYAERAPGAGPRPDDGVGGVRLYLEDGTSVVTDGDGRFSFPAVRPGQHVLRLDDDALPAGVRPYADRPLGSPRTLLRLIHGVDDAGLIQDCSFALEAAR